MDDYPAIYNFIENAEASIRKWADGYGIDPDDPSYNNNAKYWAMRAKNVANTMNFVLDPSTGILTYTFEEP